MNGASTAGPGGTAATGAAATDGRPAAGASAAGGSAALAARFEEQRPRLRAVAYRMLGSHSEAEDAVQETWLRLARTDSAAIENLGGWLTTVIARVCLTMLRARATRREELFDGHLPDPVVTRAPVGAGPGGGVLAGPADDPAEEVLLADAVSLALLVVLDTLSPAERLAFVLHDLFAVPFEEVAGIAGRSPAAVRQLASRARRRVRGASADQRPPESADPARDRAVVDAFLAAARGGDFDALVAVLDPEVVLRVDTGALVGVGSGLLRGAAAVAGQALSFSRAASPTAVAVLVNGAPGVLSVAAGRPAALLGFTVREGRITAMDILADADRLARLGLSDLASGEPG